MLQVWIWGSATSCGAGQVGQVGCVVSWLSEMGGDPTVHGVCWVGVRGTLPAWLPSAAPTSITASVCPSLPYLGYGLCTRGPQLRAAARNRNCLKSWRRTLVFSFLLRFLPNISHPLCFEMGAGREGRGAAGCSHAPAVGSASASLLCAGVRPFPWVLWSCSHAMRVPCVRIEVVLMCRFCSFTTISDNLEG